MSKIEYEFAEDGLARVYDEGKWYLIDKNHCQVGDSYDYIEAWGEGFYKVERGVRKNIMRHDGSLVLKDWHHDVFPVKNGFFEFGDTIRKSKNNPKTRYPRGLAHVSGIIVMPMIFDRMKWLENEVGLYAEIEEKPYILTLDGSIFDPTCSHLPPRRVVNTGKFFEEWVNWVLPGLQFFYRDTDAPINVEKTYHVGKILHAGIFVDVSKKLWRPAHRTRFLIASAHAALLCENKEMVRQHPVFKEWGLCTFHYDSYFKVLDIYKLNGVTQVFLLHIPYATVGLLKNPNIAMVMHSGNLNFNLVEKARQSFEEKFRMEVHPRSLDRNLVNRMSHPIGLDADFQPVSMDRYGDNVPKHILTLGKIIHRMAKDQDINGFYDYVDAFPFHGIKNSVCQGCMYANAVTNKADRCGCLLKKQFRQNYVKGECEYRKTSYNELSIAEKREYVQIKKEGLVAAKKSDAFALKLVRDFVHEKLGDDVNRLLDFDFHSLSREDCLEDKYASCSGYAFSPEKTVIVRAIVSLVFGRAWNDFSFYDIEKGKFSIEYFNPFFLLFGTPIGIEWGEKIFKGLDRHNPSDELRERVFRYYRLYNSIGNLILLPSMLARKIVEMNLSRTKRKWREYPDDFLMELYDEFVKSNHKNEYLKAESFSNSKFYTSCNTPEGFSSMIEALCLEEYVDGNGVPKEVFRTKCSFDRTPDCSTYLAGIDEFLDFCERVIPKRARLIINTLNSVLK